MADTMEGLITIDNFEVKMPKITHPSTTNAALYGLVDMGSNGIRFSITDLSPPSSRALTCIYRERAGISLYDALHGSTPDSKPFYFPQPTITDVAETLARFKDICDNYGVPKSNIQVFATEAMRTAKNKNAMLDAIDTASGLKVDILSPAMESMFGAMGARSGFQHVNGLFMDLGGGSVQMTYVNSVCGVPVYYTLSAKAAKSMPYGAARLTEVLKNQGNAGADAAKSDLNLRMKDTFEALKAEYPELRQAEREGVTIFFCGGGFRGYGSMLMHTDPIQPYPIPAIGGYTAPGDRFIQWRQMLKANDQDCKIFGMSKRRREQFPAIVTVVRAVVEAVPRIKEVVFCSGGNREGVLYMRLSPEIRESDPLDQFMDCDPGVVAHITNAIPKDWIGSLNRNLINYLAKAMYDNVGRGDDSNSAAALHRPISGSLSATPGFDHKLRAIFALMMCARWGTDIGPVDKVLYTSLQTLVGPQLSWKFAYLGTVARLIATLIPRLPSAGKAPGTIDLSGRWAYDLGRKGKKEGIRLKLKIQEGVIKGLKVDDLVGLFDRINKGVSGCEWKVEVEVSMEG